MSIIGRSVLSKNPVKPIKRHFPKRIRAYLREQSACCKPSTVRGYQVNLSHFQNWLREANGDRPFPQQIARLTKPLLQDYLSYLNERDLVPYTKVNYLLSVRKYLAWEADRSTVKEDLLEALDRKHLPKVPEYLPRPLSSENDRLLQKILCESKSPYAPLFLLLRQTGMRIGELINLPKDCVITNDKEEKYLKVPLGKMDNERLVPLTGESLELIEGIRKAPPLKENRWDPNRLIGLSGPASSVYRLLAHRFEKILGGMIDQERDITFHRLRHTYATSLLTAGVGLVSLMKLLGHRRIEMTLRYAKVTPSHLRNEYLKAIRILENQSAVTETQKSGEITGLLHPSEIIRQIASFLSKTNASPPLQKKNLLLRLSRITRDLSKIPFSQKFKINLPRENQTS